MSNLNDNPEKSKSFITGKLVKALTDYYHPAETLQESDDPKTTSELLNEMSDMEEIQPYEINKLMEENGFKIQYDGSSYKWLLKVR